MKDKHSNIYGNRHCYSLHAHSRLSYNCPYLWLLATFKPNKDTKQNGSHTISITGIGFQKPILTPEVIGTPPLLQKQIGIEGLKVSLNLELLIIRTEPMSLLSLKITTLTDICNRI